MQPDKKLLEYISANLTRLKDERGLSYKAIADMTGDPVMTIHNAIIGKNMPGTGVLARLAEAFGVSVDELIQKPTRQRKVEKTV